MPAYRREKLFRTLVVYDSGGRGWFYGRCAVFNTGIGPKFTCIRRVVQPSIFVYRVLASFNHALGSAGCRRHNEVGIHRTKRNLAEAQAGEGTHCGAVLGDERPGGASIRRAQDAQTVVGIARTVRLPGANQNHALRRIVVARLNCDRSHRQRRLIISKRGPNDISSIRACCPGVAGLPDTSIRPAEINRISSRISRINCHRSRPA